MQPENSDREIGGDELVLMTTPLADLCPLESFKASVAWSQMPYSEREKLKRWFSREVRFYRLALVDLPEAGSDVPWDTGAAEEETRQWEETLALYQGGTSPLAEETLSVWDGVALSLAVGVIVMAAVCFFVG